MTVKMDIITNEEILKEKLIPCRELCPMLLDVFLWKQDFYAYGLAGFVTFVFGTLWYWNPSVITALSLLGLVITVADFLLPTLSKSVVAEETWSSEKEKKFSIFVNRIAYYGVQLWNFQVQLDEWKKDKPNIYAATVISCLLLTAWVGNTVNNLILVYFLVLFIALLPGLLHRRILQSCLAQVAGKVAVVLGIKRKTK